MNTRRPVASLALALTFALAACGAPPGGPGETATVASPVSAPVDDCTADTALVPGVPGSPGHLVPTEISPDGQSELALMMRTMQADLRTAREAIVAGKPVAGMRERHRKMRCSWPTTASDRNPVFDGFAQAYLAKVAVLEAAPPAQAAEAFHGVLDACRACHEQSCPGPIAAIEALRITP
jgi:hypothetical protein